MKPKNPRNKRHRDQAQQRIPSQRAIAKSQSSKNNSNTSLLTSIPDKTRVHGVQETPSRQYFSRSAYRPRSSRRRGASSAQGKITMQKRILVNPDGTYSEQDLTILQTISVKRDRSGSMSPVYEKRTWSTQTVNRSSASAFGHPLFASGYEGRTVGMGTDHHAGHAYDDRAYSASHAYANSQRSRPRYEPNMDAPFDRMNSTRYQPGYNHDYHHWASQQEKMQRFQRSGFRPTSAMSPSAMAQPSPLPPHPDVGAYSDGLSYHSPMSMSMSMSGWHPHHQSSQSSSRASLSRQYAGSNQPPPAPLLKRVVDRINGLRSQRYSTTVDPDQPMAHTQMRRAHSTRADGRTTDEELSRKNRANDGHDRDTITKTPHDVTPPPPAPAPPQAAIPAAVALLSKLEYNGIGQVTMTTIPFETPITASMHTSASSRPPSTPPSSSDAKDPTVNTHQPIDQPKSTSIKATSLSSSPSQPPSAKRGLIREEPLLAHSPGSRVVFHPYAAVHTPHYTASTLDTPLNGRSSQPLLLNGIRILPASSPPRISPLQTARLLADGVDHDHVMANIRSHSPHLYQIYHPEQQQHHHPSNRHSSIGSQPRNQSHIASTLQAFASAMLSPRPFRSFSSSERKGDPKIDQLLLDLTNKGSESVDGTTGGKYEDPSIQSYILAQQLQHQWCSHPLDVKVDPIDGGPIDRVSIMDDSSGLETNGRHMASVTSNRHHHHTHHESKDPFDFTNRSRREQPAMGMPRVTHTSETLTHLNQLVNDQQSHSHRRSSTGGPGHGSELSDELADSESPSSPPLQASIPPRSTTSSPMSLNAPSYSRQTSPPASSPSSPRHLHRVRPSQKGASRRRMQSTTSGRGISTLARSTTTPAASPQQRQRQRQSTEGNNRKPKGDEQPIEPTDDPHHVGVANPPISTGIGRTNRDIDQYDVTFGHANDTGNALANELARQQPHRKEPVEEDPIAIPGAI